MSPTSGDGFDEVSAQPWVERWDALMTLHLPWRDEALTTASRLMEALGATGPLLDLGCGTASFAAGVLDRESDRSVTVLEWDLVMLALARARLGGRARVVEADLTSERWSSGLGQDFDAVVSCAVLHILDRSRYRTVAAELFSILRPGGVFVDIDEMPLPPDAPRLAREGAGLRQEQIGRRLAEGAEDFPAWLAAVSVEAGIRPLLQLRKQRLGAWRDGQVADADERRHALLAVGFTEVQVMECRLDTAMLVAVR